MTTTERTRLGRWAGCCARQGSPCRRPDYCASDRASDVCHDSGWGSVGRGAKEESVPGTVTGCMWLDDKPLHTGSDSAEKPGDAADDSGSLENVFGVLGKVWRQPLHVVCILRQR